MAPRRTRWKCPECGGGLLATARLRSRDVRKYCLKCSKETGLLVERSSPALENERQRRKGIQKRKKKKQAEKAREKERQYYTVGGIDLRDELKRMRRLKAFGGAKGSLANRNITLKIRRSSSFPSTRLGYAKYWNGEIGITAYPGIDAHDARETLLHELVHLYVGVDFSGGPCHHGQGFKHKFREAMDEAFGFVVNVYSDSYHGKIAAELRRREKV